MIVFREADLSDLSTLSALMSELDLPGESPVPISPEVFERVVANPDHRVYLACDGDTVVGVFALIIVTHMHGSFHSAIVEDVVVRSDRQGQGIGRQMMQFAADEARAAGCYKIVLSSSLQRPVAHHLYDDLGYTRYGYSYSLELD